MHTNIHTNTCIFVYIHGLNIGMQQTERSGGFGADKSGASRGGQARHKHGKAGTVDSEQLWVTGTGSRSGTARALGKGESKNGAM
jgi:hypothetical protein